MAFWKLLILVGVLLLSGATLLIGMSVYESSRIPAYKYKDPPVGEFLIAPLIGLGLISIGYGIAHKRQG